MIFSEELKAKFFNWGIVDVGYTDELTPLSLNQYNEWIKNKKHLPLGYLEGERQEKRQNLKIHWNECQSAIVFLFSYQQARQGINFLYQNEKKWNGLKLASYTLGFEGFDYHDYLKSILNHIGTELCQERKGLEFKLALDTHPVLERDLAARSGLGWFGKNSMLIHRTEGSFFIIGSLLLNQNLPWEVKKMETDHCGQCSLCVEACPTQAIDQVTRTIIAKDCISTFTIEQFKLETIPSEKMTLKEGTLFGCDICQDVCPWNRRFDRKNPLPIPYQFSDQQKKILDFFLLRDRKSLAQDLEKMSERQFRRFFEKTSFERSGRRGVLKNVRLLLNILS